MKLSNLVNSELIFLDIDHQNKDSAIESIIDKLCETDKTLNNSTIVDLIQKREKLCSTALDNYVAIPHTKIPGISRTRACLGICQEGVDFGSIDELKTKILILILHPENTDNHHLDILRSVATIFAKKNVVSEILSLNDKNLIYQIIQTNE